MLKRLVTFALGEWGMAVLHFYYANSIWINSIVVLYILILTIAYVNYRNIQQRVIELLQKEFGSHPNKKIFSFSLENLSVKKPIIPVLSAKFSFTPYRFDNVSLEKLLNKDADILKLREDIKVQIT